MAVISQPDLRWKRCDIKSTNLLANVLAIEAARRAGAFEAVLIDAQGFVTEATHTSLLWVRDGRLEGTPEGHEILPGMTRQLVLRLVERARDPVRGRRMSRSRAEAGRRADPGGDDDRGRAGGPGRWRPDRRRAARADRRAAACGLPGRP